MDFIASKLSDRLADKPAASQVVLLINWDLNFYSLSIFCFNINLLGLILLRLQIMAFSLGCVGVSAGLVGGMLAMVP